MSGEALGRDQSRTTRGTPSIKTTLKMLSSQQKVKTEMITLGLIPSILVAASGGFLLVTAKDDALASTSGMVFAILGSTWVVLYYAMLMGW